MPVFDFNRMPETGTDPVCTYVTFRSNEPEASPEKPILVLDNSLREWAHHSTGKFTNPVKRTSFEFDTPDGVQSADILRIDARFTSLLGWLGENHINVRLSGRTCRRRHRRAGKTACFDSCLKDGAASL